MVIAYTATTGRRVIFSADLSLVVATYMKLRIETRCYERSAVSLPCWEATAAAAAVIAMNMSWLLLFSFMALKVVRGCRPTADRIRTDR